MRDVKKLFSLEVLGKFIRESGWFTAMVAVLSLGACLIFWFFPFPGGAIGVLGAVAALMAFREIGHGERAMWTIVVFLLLFVELRAIRVERRQNDNEQRKALAEERAHFTEIAGGIKPAIRVGDEHFTAAMQQTDGLIRTSSQAVRAAKEGIDAAIGGNSFCWFLVT
jgi:membrane protein implicated in regulation of membrane protease activity